ncbi:DMT family transporter [Shewanella baltica]|uniref:DMT family transporter n=1 Tax=Shewanella baltica TaxID=62322 RepID=UPI00217CF552|nr:DMT family transporter [Shewanella baltica]MCS6125509.1 DMT family transporter [Shewanella baltica]
MSHLTITKDKLMICLFFIIPPLLWSCNFIVGRAIRNDLSPVMITFSRWLIALMVILPFAHKYLKRDFHQYLQYPIRVIATAVTGVLSFSILVYSGLHHTSSTNALLLNSCVPVFILLFSAVVYKQPLNARQFFGLCLSFIGVLSIIFKGDLKGLLSLQLSQGDLLLLMAMISFAFYTLWLKRIPYTVNRLGLLSIQIVITLLGTLPFVLWESYSGGSQQHWSNDIYLAVLFLGIGPSFISYLLFSRCVEAIGAERAGFSIHLIPIFGVILSLLFLGESIHWFHMVGCATILFGVGLSSMQSERNSRSCQ